MPLAQLISASASLGSPGGKQEADTTDCFSDGLINVVRQALEKAVDLDTESTADIGLIVGSVYQTRERLEGFLQGVFETPPSPSPRLFPDSTSSVAAGKVAQALGLMGPVLTLNSSPLFPVAMDLLRGGQCQTLIVAAGERYSPLIRECLASTGKRFMPLHPGRYLEAYAATILVQDSIQDEGSPILLGYGVAASSDGVAWESAIAVAAKDAVAMAEIAPSEISGIILATGRQSEATTVGTALGLVGESRFIQPRANGSLGTASVLEMCLLCPGGENPDDPQRPGASIDAGTWLVNALFPPSACSSLIVRWQ